MADNDNNPFTAAAAEVMHSERQSTATAIRNNVQFAVGQNPDQAAQYQHLAKYVGVPVETVQAQPEAIKQQAALQAMDANRLATDYPTLGKYLVDPNNAAKSHDDIAPLAAVEGATKALPVPNNPPPDFNEGRSFVALPDQTPTLRDRLANWWAGVVGGPTAEQQRQQQGAAEANAILAARKSDPSLVPPANATPAQITELNNKAWEQSRNAIGGMSQVPQIAAERFVKSASFGLISPVTSTQSHSWQASTSAGLGDLAGFIVGPAKLAGKAIEAVPGVARLTPAAGDAWATGLAQNVVKQAAVLGLASGAQETGGALLDSNSVSEGAGKIAHGAATGAGIGAIFGAAGKILPDNTIAQWAARAVGVSAAQDAMTGASVNDDRPLEDKIFSYAMNAFFTMHGGGRTGGNWFTSNPEVRKGYEDANKAEAAQQGAQGLQALGELATASKTRSRDPEGFKNLVRNMTEDGSLQDVYVDANKFAEVLNQSGVNIDQLSRLMPDVAAQFQEAVHTNGDIRIPVEDYATHIAGGPADANLLPHLKVDPDGMTYQQGQEFFQNQQAEMQSLAERLLTQKHAEDTAAADAQVVHDKVLDQLNAAGRFQPAVNNAYAAMTRDFYKTQADRLGITPAEMYDRYPLKITSESLAKNEKRFGQDNGWGSIETEASDSGPTNNPKGTYSPATATIRLFKNADLSTFLHESGHFYLDTLQKVVSLPNAPEGMRADFDTLLKSFGEKGKSPEQRLADWSTKDLDGQRAGHEQFARSFEKYLMDGKAPTLELQGMFARFRSWLMNVYRSFSELPDSFSPDVRGVMDRLMATEEAIHQTEQARSYMPLREAPEGTTPEQFAAYQELGREATDQAVADMTGRSMRDMKWASNARAKALRSLQKEADRERKAIREEVTKEVNAEPVEQARNSLKKGGMVGPDGDLAPDTRPLGSPKLKLKTADIHELYPESMLARPDLAPLKGLSGKEGLHPDIVADMFGFRDGRALVDALLDGKPKEKIEGMTDQRMLERHGELTDPVAIERAAEAAVHNEARARFVATGLKMLSKSPIPARQLALAAKEAADTAIAAKRVRDLRPAQYAAAETRSNREAIKLAPKDPAGAVQAQRAALLNNRLFKSATDAVTEVQKGIDYLKKFDKPAVREKIELEYRDQIDTLLDRFDLRKSTTLTSLDMRESLLNFVERMAAQGNEPQVPEALLNEAMKQHYKDMTVEEFRGLLDAVKSIETMGRKAQMVADGQEMREIAALATEAQAAMAALPQRAPESNRGLTRMESKWLDVKSAGRSMQAALLKMEQMIDWLDNRNANGVLNRVVFRRIADAGVHEYDMQTKVKTEIDKLLHTNLKDVTKEGNKIYVADGLIDGLTGQAQRFTKKEMLSLAGNMGNDSNMSKLLAGEKWSETAVWDFLNKNMTKADWDFVAGLGKTLETLWPEKLAMSRRLGNTNPEKIAPRAFDTPHGRYDGWYWPMVYDPARAQDVAERGAKAGDSMFENIYTRADTDTGRMNTRNENYARPLLLSLDTIPRVIKDEIHDIAYREAIMDADKFLSNKVVRESITNALSPEHYAQLRPWLQSIANDRKVDMQALKWFDQLAHGARTRATIVGLGYRVSTMLVHGSSAALESVAEVGPVWFAKGLADFSNPRNWVANKDFIFERSGEMRNRMNEVDRDVREHLREIDLRLMDTTSSAVARGSDLMKAHAYQGIAMLDMASALPTWMGAYHKGMAPEAKGGRGMSEADAVYFADKTVRNAHGGTGIKDQAAVQRGPEFFKLFTMFYTFWNHNVNRLMDTGRLIKHGAWKDPEMAGTVAMRFLIYTLGIQVMHHAFHPAKDDEGETNWLKWAGKEFTAAAFAGIPILRDLSSHYLTGRDYGVTPAASMVDAVGKSGIDAANALTGKDANDKWLKHTINTTGYVFGLPLGQASNAGQFLWDVGGGRQDPQDIVDWWRGLMHGDINKR